MSKDEKEQLRKLVIKEGFIDVFKTLAVIYEEELEHNQ